MRKHCKSQWHPKIAILAAADGLEPRENPFSRLSCGDCSRLDKWKLFKFKTKSKNDSTKRYLIKAYKLWIMNLRRLEIHNFASNSQNQTVHEETLLQIVFKIEVFDVESEIKHFLWWVKYPKSRQSFLRTKFGRFRRSKILKN